jgi:hypothetical protein
MLLVSSNHWRPKITPFYKKVFTIKIKNHDTFTNWLSPYDPFYYQLLPIRCGHPGQTNRVRFLALVLDLAIFTNYLYDHLVVPLGYPKTAFKRK